MLGLTKALLPRNRRRKSETSEEIDYAEIKAYRDIGAKVYYNGESAAKPFIRNVQRACTPSGVSGRLPFVGFDVLSSSR